jgi:hypothetical protein
MTSLTSSLIINTESRPPHRSYYFGAGHANFEEFDYSRGSQYMPNPNTLAPQEHAFTIPHTPVARGISVTPDMVDHQAGTDTEEYPMGPVGVALDSVHIFNDQAAPSHDIANEVYTFDSYGGHPTDTHDYHYHTSSPGPLEVLRSAGLTSSTRPGDATLEVYGIMCDGTLVLGCTELNGMPPAALMDAQNGHLHDVVDENGTIHFTNRYHTHICSTEYPAHPYTPEIQYYSTCLVSQPGP